MALAGVEIFSNGSGSHHQLRKLDQRLSLIQSATAKVGGRRGAQGEVEGADQAASQAVP
jgi:hypothetical protein